MIVTYRYYILLPSKSYIDAHYAAADINFELYKETDAICKVLCEVGNEVFIRNNNPVMIQVVI